jgi:hypothetical protein
MIPRIWCGRPSPARRRAERHRLGDELRALDERACRRAAPRREPPQRRRRQPEADRKNDRAQHSRE